MAKVQTDIRGLNTGGIGRMQTAIENYKKAIVPGVQNVGISVANVTKGLKGANTAKAINTMGKEIQNEVGEMLTELDKFSKKLDEVKAAYVAYDSKAAEHINATTNKVKAVKS